MLAADAGAGQRPQSDGRVPQCDGGRPAGGVLAGLANIVSPGDSGLAAVEQGAGGQGRFPFQQVGRGGDGVILDAGAAAVKPGGGHLAAAGVQPGADDAVGRQVGHRLQRQGVNADEGQVGGHHQPFGGADAYPQRTERPRPQGDGHAVQRGHG